MCAIAPTLSSPCGGAPPARPPRTGEGTDGRAGAKAGRAANGAPVKRRLVSGGKRRHVWGCHFVAVAAVEPPGGDDGRESLESMVQTLPEEIVETVVEHFLRVRDIDPATNLPALDVGKTVDALALAAAQFVAALPPDARPALARRFLKAFQDELVKRVVSDTQEMAAEGVRVVARDDDGPAA